VIYTSNYAGHPKFSFGQERNDKVDLVITGCGNNDLTLGKPGTLKSGDFAGICYEGLSTIEGTSTSQRRVAINKQNLVTVSKQFSGDCLTDFSCSRDGDPHD
jgi:hypothetical protein